MKHVLSVQDLSCVGRCSLTVALPVLSAMGCRCSVLPTAVLSTHTAFPGPEVVSMTEHLAAFAGHWEACGVRFDAVMTGYLSDPEQAKVLTRLTKRWHEEGSLVITDPAMGDNGKLYSGMTDEHVAAMKELCRQADILLPNVTEAALLTGIPYRAAPDEAYLEALADALLALGPQAVILTGITGAGALGPLPEGAVSSADWGSVANNEGHSLRPCIRSATSLKEGGKAQAFPSGEGGTALAVTDEVGSPVGADALGPLPEGAVSSADWGSAIKDEGHSVCGARHLSAALPPWHLPTAAHAFAPLHPPLAAQGNAALRPSGPPPSKREASHNHTPTIGIYGKHRTDGKFSYRTECIPRSFHGTGDLFAAVFTGALMTTPAHAFTGAAVCEAAKKAASFVKACAAGTQTSTPHGVEFEPLLKTLLQGDH